MFATGRGALLAAVWLALAGSAPAASDFGDVSVGAAAMYQGSTFHGYAETRVTLENHSHSRSHEVTLVYPNHAYGYGNSLSRLSRTVKLAPEARETVSLLQPPLPAMGDNTIRVEVDGDNSGEVHAPNANNHCNAYSRSGVMATVFISRSLDFDAIEKVFQANQGGFTAGKAVGPPDVRTRGISTEAWMPDARRGGRTNWLELDYTPQTVDHVSLYFVKVPATPGDMLLTDATGTNKIQLPFSSGTGSWSSATWILEFTLPTPMSAVKTVQLNFGTEPPYNVGVDAVQISGPAGKQWAADARASSDNSASAGSFTGSGSSGDTVTSLRAEAPVTEWSENWLAYTPFDAVALSATDLESMPAAVLTALGDYLAAGGNVVLFGTTSLPAAWHAAKTKQRFDGTEYEIGFGSCYAFPVGPPDGSSVQVVRNAVRQNAFYWQALPFDSKSANAAFPVVDNLKIPTRGIVVIMLLFIIVIGPVNMVYLNRIKRRTWMLWTIPAISVGTTLLVFAYSLLREGIKPDSRIGGITMLDQVSHHAATIGATAFYCPLTPSAGLRFEPGTEVTPLVHLGYDSSGSPREIDWSQSQHLRRGWVSARVPAYFHLRKSETRRERLQIVNDNGRLSAVNGLGMPIKSLWYADANLHVYSASGIAAGQQAGLITSAAPAEGDHSGASGLLRELTFAADPAKLADIPARCLLPNTYIAVLEGNPFEENGLGAAARPTRTRSSAVVFGLLETPHTP